MKISNIGYTQGLKWLKEYIHFRCKHSFSSGNKTTLTQTQVPKYALDTKSGDLYTQSIINLCPSEHLAVLTAVANQLYPDIWNEFAEVFSFYNEGNYPDPRIFGLLQPTETPYLQATIGTVLFLLVGDDLEKQRKAWPLFFLTSPLYTLNILERPQNTSIPALNTIPQLTQPFLQQLLTDEETQPQYSPDFPATLLTTTKTWDDLILEERTTTLVTQARKWVQHYTQVSTQPGVHQDKGYRLLMSGPSGTGKTMAAALLGQDAGKPVYRIDISNIVDKYVGETSKKLRRIFEVAEAQDWILFFDEGDALFGKRSEGGQSSNERYANQEVSYLLYKMEEYKGMIFLATNHRSAIDSAFKRRFDSLIRFDQPDKYTLQKLWHHFFEKPGYLQLDPAITRANWRELAEGAKVSAAWIEKFYAYCVMQAIHSEDTYISPQAMHQYLYWFGCEHGHFEKNTTYLFQKQYQE